MAVLWFIFSHLILDRKQKDVYHWCLDIQSHVLFFSYFHTFIASNMPLTQIYADLYSLIFPSLIALSHLTSCNHFKSMLSRRSNVKSGWDMMTCFVYVGIVKWLLPWLRHVETRADGGDNEMWKLGQQEDLRDGKTAMEWEKMWGQKGDL